MAVTFTFDRSVTIQGVRFTTTTTAASDGLVQVDRSGTNALAAAKAGTLTTRTDDNTGVLTLGSGHGILTGDRVDVYWSGGARYGMTVGTVSGTSVPIDLGAGTVLPDPTTPVAAAVPVVDNLAISSGTDAFVGVSIGDRGLAVFVDGSAAVIAAVEISAVNKDYWVDSSTWSAGPFAATACSKVYLSQAGVTSPVHGRVIVGYN